MPSRVLLTTVLSLSSVREVVRILQTLALDVYKFGSVTLDRSSPLFVTERDAIHI